jgi:hypothetical protein
MATDLEHDAPGPDVDAKYRDGWRLVNETGPDGALVSRQVPLTEAGTSEPLPPRGRQPL